MGPGSDRGVALLPGISLPERYEPIRPIARGGMASVWCALDRTLDRHVAIKLLAQPYASDELAGRRFTREARVAARLSAHPNVVTIYDVGRAPPCDELPRGRPFIVMEHVPGGTVADALRVGEYNQPLVLEWLHQAADAIDYAHRRGVIHRDVKLSNFLLDRERVLHVADFGIAQLGTEDTLSGTGEVLGTAAYLAPERAMGLPATEASDRYALAVAAFELLVGERPFGAEHFAAQARQHIEDPPPAATRRNGRLPAAIDPVLARGMAKRPDERFASASQLVEEIEHALLRTRARPAQAPARIPPPRIAPARIPPPRPMSVHATKRRRRRAVLLSALAAAVVCVALAVASSVMSSGPARPAAGRADAATQTKPRAHHAARDTSPSAGAPVAWAPPSPTTAAALEAQGHQLMVAGDYQSAIGVLRQAVAASPHTSLTYAYALYDLGHSLRLAGDARAAVPILRQRLQIPNQTGVVRHELALALQALGQSPSTGD